MAIQKHILTIGDCHVRLEHGSITDVKVDAVVTAANKGLMGGGGVDYYVHAAAGPKLLAACREIGGCATGSAVATPAFDLENRGVRRVIHAVGPVWHGGTHNEDALLRGAYLAALKLADIESCRSMALPAISCGVYRFPVGAASRIAMETVAAYLGSAHGPLRTVLFVLFDGAVFDTFAQTLAEKTRDMS